MKRSTVWVLPPDGTRGIEAQALPYAPALAAAGVDLLRTIFVQPATPREGLWAIEQALRAQHLGAVIGWLPPAGTADSDFKALRRLHLLAQRHSVARVRAARHATCVRALARRAAPATRERRPRARNHRAEATRPAAAGAGRADAASRTLGHCAGRRRNRVTPNVQPASKTSLLAARSLQALLDH